MNGGSCPPGHGAAREAAPAGGSLRAGAAGAGAPAAGRRERPAVTGWTWDGSADGTGGCGVHDDRERARDAAMAWLRANPGGTAVLGPARFIDGTRSLSSGWTPAGRPERLPAASPATGAAAASAVIAAWDASRSRTRRRAAALARELAPLPPHRPVEPGEKIAARHQVTRSMASSAARLLTGARIIYKSGRRYYTGQPEQPGETAL